MLLIQNAHLIDPASRTDGIRDILIEGEKIIKIAEHIAPEEAAGCGPETAGAAAGADEKTKDASGKTQAAPALTVLNAEGLTAIPGLVDAHVHFRDPGFTWKEDIDSGARAAAAGGVTTVVLMANTKPCVDNADTLRYVLEKGEKTPIHVATCANVTLGMKGKELVDMKALHAAGAAGFTDDGIPLLSEETARAAMEAAAEEGVPISFHEENPAFIRNNGINAGKASAHFGIGGSDRQAEIDMVERDVRLAQETGACVVIQHISTKEAVELVRQARRKGADVHAEATPHHFTLTEEAAIQYGTLAKMNPPLREEADRQAIIEGLADGTIDMIATDHAPHSAEEKAKPVTEAPSGIIGLETSLALGISELADTGRLTLTQLIERMSLAPARLYGLDAGYLAEGGPADLVLFDPAESWTPERFYSRSQNSPFLGKTLKGKIHATICRGRVVYPFAEERAN